MALREKRPRAANSGPPAFGPSRFRTLSRFRTSRFRTSDLSRFRTSDLSRFRTSDLSRFRTSDLAGRGRGRHHATGTGPHDHAARCRNRPGGFPTRFRPGGRAVPPVTPCRPGGSEQGAERLLGNGGRIEPDLHPLEGFGFPYANSRLQPGYQGRYQPPGWWSLVPFPDSLTIVVDGATDCARMA